MLETVIERPVRVQAWLEERERRNRAIYKESWEKVMARQEAFGEVQKRKRRGDRDQFLLMIERQRLLNQPRDDDRSERWARFVEQGASADGQMGGVDAAPLQP